MTHDRFLMTDDRVRPQVMAAERALDELEDHAADRLGAARRAIIELERTATAALQERDTVPRVVTADELREGDMYAVISLHEDGNALIDVTFFLSGYNQPAMVQGEGGWIMKDAVLAIVLLQDATAAESEQGVTVQQLEDAEPGSQYIAGELISTKRTTGLWGIGVLRDPLTSEELLRIAEHQGADGYIDPQEPEPVKVGDTISTEEQLKSLPPRTVLRDGDGNAFEKAAAKWRMTGSERLYPSDELIKSGPFTALCLSEEDA